MILLLACASPDSVTESVTPREDAPAVTPAGPVLKRLTRTQYTNAVHDLLGASIVVSDDLEPDAASGGLLVVGGTVNSLSAMGVEQYETSAFAIAEQAIADSTVRATLIPCTTEDEACTRTTLETFGRRAWRRPLTTEELDRITAIATTTATTLGTWDQGIEYGVAAILESPHFVYRVEIGENGQYTSLEMATRLSFFLWNTTPDDELLAAGEAGDLATDAGIDAQVERMLADDRARQGVRTFFDEMFALYELEDLSKDPTIYVHMGAEVGASAREEALSLAEWLTFDEDGDYRDFYTTTTAFVDPKLATIYRVPAPSMDGFAKTELPDDGGRRGFFGSVAFLAQQAHPTSTSPTRRGALIRERIFCTPLSPPPADVDASIPEPSADAPTMRERLEEHMSNPSCSGCHLLTDPIGLGFENFDGLGGWRTTENDTPIDPSGDLDGVYFDDAWGLAQLVHDHTRTGPCLSNTLYQYATAHAATEDEEDLMRWHADGFADNGYRIQWLIQDLAASPGFRQVGVAQ